MKVSWEGLSHILWKVLKFMFQTTNQVIYLSIELGCFMLAYIPAPWILWVMVRHGGCKSTFSPQHDAVPATNEGNETWTAH